MLGSIEILIIIFLFLVAASNWPFLKKRSKKFKVSIILFLLCLASVQYIQTYRLKKDNAELLNSIKSVKSGNNEILTHTKSRPVIDLELEHYENGDYLYIVNEGLEPANDIQILPLSDKLKQKHISSLGNTNKKELIGTLFFDDYPPSTKIRVEVYFHDSSSIYYHWEFSVDRSGIQSILRQHFNKLPNGDNDFKNPIIEWKHVSY
ncbi:hypothetical protein OAC89_00665 [Deltaproteobacteria bacterium]|nr:hypothetical protein [Deltaproteobacteria bacterium]